MGAFGGHIPILGAVAMVTEGPNEVSPSSMEDLAVCTRT